MSKPNLISTIRFLSLATAALVTGPTATYAATNPSAPKLDAVEVPCLQNEATVDDEVYKVA